MFAGLTMVSNVPYYSFKTINLKKSVPFLAIFVFVLVIALLSYQPAIVLFAGFVAYALSGLRRCRRGCGSRRRRRRRADAAGLSARPRRAGLRPLRRLRNLRL